MQFIVPSYYDLFRCKAEKCTDNCCIGWEIDIDADAMTFYNSVGGAFGERLKQNIKDGCFCLHNDRCAFLNEKNLCDIIIHCGAHKLCQICRDHPRYFEWFSDRKEGGLGLSCEEAARLILTQDPFSFTKSETNEKAEPVDEDLFAFLLTAREQIFTLLQDKTLPLSEKLIRVLLFALHTQQKLDGGEVQEETQAQENDILHLYADFDPIDDTWKQQLQQALSVPFLQNADVGEDEETYIVNLCAYFILRYFLKGVFDGEILSKVKFAVVSPLVIAHFCDGAQELGIWIEKSKIYSKQMEYSDENRELFYDYTYACSSLAVARLTELIRKKY